MRDCNKPEDHACLVQQIKYPYQLCKGGENHPKKQF